MYYFQLRAPCISAETGYQTGAYKPQVIALAEGLLGMGREIGANIDYYCKGSNAGFLLQKTKFEPEKINCLIVSADAVFDIDVPTQTRMNTCKKLHVPVLVLDWIASRFFCSNQELLLQRCHRYLFYSYVPELLNRGATIIPWPIGFTERVIQMCKCFEVPFGARRRKILWSHRVAHHIRKSAWEKFYAPLDKLHLVERFNDHFEHPPPLLAYDLLMSHQTGKRHNPKFYEALCEVQMADCCGGFMVGNLIRQWDSYKLWEAFVAGCCVITLDLEHYGFKTGAAEEPRNMVHYIGLRLNQPAYMQELQQQLTLNAIDIQKIAEAGREWALKHFSPLARATSFCTLIEEITVEESSKRK
jgi:hypothetical protein